MFLFKKIPQHSNFPLTSKIRRSNSCWANIPYLEHNDISSKTKWLKIYYSHMMIHSIFQSPIYFHILKSNFWVFHAEAKISNQENDEISWKKPLHILIHFLYISQIPDPHFSNDFTQVHPFKIWKTSSTIQKYKTHL